MNKIASADGTLISYTSSGEGPPLVLVHGSGASSMRWAPVLPGLEPHFSVFAVDRRGYGGSEDSSDYVFEREVEDLAAVVNSIEEPVHLLGHSFGALCALEAALITSTLRRLVLYEPGIVLPGAPLYPAGILNRLQALLDAGDREGMVTTLFREVVQMPEREFEVFRSSPTWPVRVATAHLILRESFAEQGYRFVAERFKAVRVPTLLLQGGDSPSTIKAATEAVHAAVPGSRIVVLPGQQHIAMDLAPDLFLQEVIRFLLRPA